MNTPRIPRTIRAWIYGICLAAGAVAITYGILTTEETAAWLSLALAVLVPNGLAMANLGNDQPTPRRAAED